MKPRFITVEETNEEHKKLTAWVRQNPERAAYALARLQSIYDDYLKVVLTR